MAFLVMFSFSLLRVWPIHTLYSLYFLLLQELYGRSWTKIANMIDTRTALQVKNYAKQYFRQKVKTLNIRH